MSVTVTIFFDGTFFAALAERRNGDALTAAKHVFGPEPSDAEVLEWVLTQFAKLEFSPPIEAGRKKIAARNPKRRQRQAADAVSAGTGTRSQQALQLAREQNAALRKAERKARDEAEAARKFLLRQEKRREKHRGH